MMLANLFKKSNTPDYGKVKLLKLYSGDESPFYYPTAIIYVENDSPILCVKENTHTDDDYIARALTINNTPIVQYKVSKDSKNPNLIATGDGLESQREELQEIIDKLNLKYMGIKDGIEALLPMLSSLKTGIYAIADIPHYPTDGNNHFFWNVPNHMEENQAISPFYSKENKILEGGPRYLYPSHHTSFYNEELVSQCICSMKNGLPLRGFAYFLEGYTSLLLKGHNIATAAAMTGSPMNCITIIPATNITKDEIKIEKHGSTNFSQEMKKAIEKDEFFVDNINVVAEKDKEALIKVDYDTETFVDFKNIYKIQFGTASIDGNICTYEQIENTIINLKKDKLNISIECDLIEKKWDPSFDKAIKIFPKIEETAQAYPFNLLEIEKRHLSMWILKDNYINLLKLSGALSYLVRTRPQEVKSIALQIAKNFNKYVSSKFDLIVTALKTLDKIDGDYEIDDFFISFLLCFGDDPRYKNTILEDIVDNHWNKKTHLERENSYDISEKKDIFIPFHKTAHEKKDNSSIKPKSFIPKEYSPIEDDFQDDDF